MIEDELKKAGISKLDAILVGHAHYDHSIDAPLISEMMECQVWGSESYGQVHQSTVQNKERWRPVSGKKQVVTVGKFTVTFVKSDHARARNFVQRAVEGEVTEPFSVPAPYWRYKCGDVYAIHIDHPEGSIVVTTSAGSEPGQFDGMRSDIVFLGIGQVTKQDEGLGRAYWHEAVEVPGPKVVVPVHWDDFTVRLEEGQLRPFPKYADDTSASIRWLHQMAGESGLRLRAMDLRDSLLLSSRRVLMAP
ncbi:MAG: MBL fold metallo-hydrolase [Verrucomicrobiota bacterium]